MDLRLETKVGLVKKFAIIGAILMLFCLTFSQNVSAFGVTLDGKTKFAGIPAGIIRDIEVVGDAVYIASENGLFRYLGGRSEKLEYNIDSNERGTISDLFFDKENTLWIVEFGVGVFKYRTDTGAAEKFRSEDKWPRYAWKIGVLEQYTVVSLITGILVVDKETGELQKWASNVAPGHVNNVLSLAVSVDGAVYLGAESGLVKIDPEKETSEVISVDTFLTDLSSVEAVSIYGEILYVGGSEGIYAYDTSNNNKSFFPLESPDYSIGPVSDIFVSSSRRIYVTAGGLYELNNGKINKPDFMAPLITSDGIRSIVKIAELPSGELLLASSQLGLISITQSHEAINLLHKGEQVLRQNIKSFGFSDEFGYGVSTQKQDYLINVETGELKPFSFWKGNRCIDENLSKYAELSKSNILNDDYCSSKFSHAIQQSDSLLYFYHDEGNKAFYSILEDGVIADKIPAPRQMLYSFLTTSGEIAGFDSDSNFHIQMSKFNWKSISPDDGKWVGLTCLIEMDEVFLLCTSGQGIKSINKGSGEISNSDLLAGTGARFIRGALHSENNHLWFLTNMGLFVVDSANDLISFNESDGVFDTDFEYRGIHQFGERLIILGDKYSYLVNEEKAITAMKAKESLKSNVVFTRAEWTDSEMRTHNFYSQPTSFQNPLTLESDFDKLSLDFRTSSFSNYDNEKLEFRILGMDDEWKLHPLSQAFLTMADLESGHYEFQARVSGDGNPITSLTFEVERPIYFQKYALGVYFLLALSFLIAYKLKYLTAFWSYFKTTNLYAHLTRYEITDGHSKFEKMLRSKERFINQITSELRTPIQVINGSLEKISDADKDTRKELVCIQDNVKRVEQLIHQMSQDVPTAFKAEDYYKSYSPENIRFIVLSLEPLAKQKRQNLEVRIKVKKSVSLISESLEKIMANLVQNAIKFTPELGTIKVSAIQDSKALKIIVNDDGEGIEENLQSKVFERFARGNTKLDGNGVGLATVKTLVELNQGEVTLQSQKGVGTKVTVTLPVDDIAFVNSQAEDLSPANAKTNKKSLLIVDDSREFRSYLFDLFSGKYRCLVARNGVQALDVMQHYLVDLVITDQMMHEMDGLGLTKAIRQNPSYANIPILMLTAETGAELEKAALEEKVDYFLAKPASNEEIILRAEHLLSVREAKEKEEDESALPVFKFGCLIIPEFDNEKDMAFYLNFIAVLEKNYQDEAFNRDQAASQLLISPRSLNRRMSELFDYNFSEFLSRFRIEKSIPLLLEGNSILDTCLDVGFGTAAYFSTSFKKVMHLPPKKYIEQYSKTVA
ncbi:hybrid sensor histidine kinase/response regulator transcription factor [Alteromonas sp. PRIM-21]|uniref:hybrid sensor histidine kinase/response regulator transcription factor n=1 Tax=Alteromonas sp. PRIM-21 TaxID=1454978 RepID=UPI0022B9B793|nr:ATP-binding protein [Alteromonas sp. PRIM-21]MCZ8531411.1 response regulator [Alteromonas sp. PRIM-21]